MYKVGICGHFGEGKNLLNGQTVKTKIITEEVKMAFGEDSIKIVDTHDWKKNPLKLLLNCYKLIKTSKNIIILPASNGVKIFVPLFVIMNKIFNRKLHYIVIGGWLPELLKRHCKLKQWLKNFDGIYVETKSMIESLQNAGLYNVRYLPNFKRLKITEEEDLIYNNNEPYRLCTFSRVMKEKGIEDAINAVQIINEYFGKIVYTLDIYGQIDNNYKERFDEIKKNFPSYISYKGVANYNDSASILKKYYALLFPTYYDGEGFAGTIIDAYAAGVPVIATNWKYNPEIINNKIDGIIYEGFGVEALKNILLRLLDDPNLLNDMKIACLRRAKELSPENVMAVLINNIN